MGNAVHLGYAAHPRLYQPLGRTSSSHSLGEPDDELQGLIPRCEQGRSRGGAYPWLRLRVVGLGHRCCDPGSMRPVVWHLELGPLGLGGDDGRLGAPSVDMAALLGRLPDATQAAYKLDRSAPESASRGTARPA